MVDFEGAAASVADAFAVPVSYHGLNGSAETRGVLSSGYQRVEGARGPAINSKRAELAILKADLDFEPRQGDTPTVEGVLYEVTSVRPDEQGTQYNLVLKRV